MGGQEWNNMKLNVTANLDLNVLSRKPTVKIFDSHEFYPLQSQLNESLEMLQEGLL